MQPTAARVIIGAAAADAQRWADLRFQGRVLMTSDDSSTEWSWLLRFAAAMIGLGWITAIIMLILTEGPPTSSWLILLASSISVLASRSQRTSPRASTALILFAAAVAVGAVVVMNP